MRRQVYLSCLALRDVSINLRGRQVGMPQELLHYLQVRPAIEEVCGEGMAQHMRMNSLVYPGADGISGQHFLHSPGQESLATVGKE